MRHLDPAKTTKEATLTFYTNQGAVVKDAIYRVADDLGKDLISNSIDYGRWRSDNRWAVDYELGDTWREVPQVPERGPVYALDLVIFYADVRPAPTDENLSGVRLALSLALARFKREHDDNLPEEYFSYRFGDWVTSRYAEHKG